MTIRSKKFILFLGDAIILFFSLYLTLLIRYGSGLVAKNWHIHFPIFAALYLIWLFVFYITSLYDINNANISLDYYQKILLSLVICGFISTAYFYFNPKINIAPKTNLFLNIIIIAALFSIWRNLFSIILKSTGKNNVLFAGYSDSAYKFAQSVNNNPQMGYKIVAFADTSPDPSLLRRGNSADRNENSGIKFLQPADDLKEFIRQNNINTIVINSQLRENGPRMESDSLRESDSNPALRAALFQYLPLGVNFISYSDFYENLYSLVPAEAIDQTWFIKNLTEGSKRTYDILKRIFDIVASIILMTLSIPIIPFIIIIIKLNDGGPIFFKQIRTGKNGKDFLAIKFRSMVVGSEKNGAQWSPENDPRITNVGKFLRKTRLDEIPQLINVLRGEMSMVGPRPERPEFIEILEKEVPFYTQRLLVKPGLTGWAQINLPYGASKEYTMLKLKYDLYYIKHRSLVLDLKIILKTVAIVFGFKGR
ncbi:MAG: sugar transferase [bacterium]